jgi:two-component system sensor histidine kinase DctS
MGMGLNICRTIVELHHGRLTISDNLHKGTIFTLTLPTKNEQKH